MDPLRDYWLEVSCGTVGKSSHCSVQANSPFTNPPSSPRSGLTLEEVVRTKNEMAKGGSRLAVCQVSNMAAVRVITQH